MWNRGNNLLLNVLRRQLLIFNMEDDSFVDVILEEEDIDELIMALEQLKKDKESFSLDVSSYFSFDDGDMEIESLQFHHADSIEEEDDDR